MLLYLDLERQFKNFVSMDYFLGVDGGGSNTRFVLTDARAEPVWIKHFGPSNIQEVCTDEVKSTFNAALNEIACAATCGSIKSAFLGIAGVTSKLDRQFLLNLVINHPTLRASTIEIDHDVRIALAGGLKGRPGIALISGTGSSCYGRNASNKPYRCGGWGSLADDIGSGGWIGIRALQKAVRQADGRDAETSILGLVKKFLQLNCMDDFLNRVHRQGLSRPQRARLAPMVVEAASDGDPAAISIIQEAVRGLAELVHTCGNKLEMDAPEVVLVGGLTKAPYFSTALKEAIVRSCPSCVFTENELSPSAGSVLLALENADVAFNKTIWKHLQQIDQSKASL
ncbi:MAG: hypothetical protein JJU20_15015 [Opitutales bacterium]|nr:hypothetical protein [Opitutales bacterium]